jgi:hypothetical protein
MNVLLGRLTARRMLLASLLAICAVGIAPTFVRADTIELGTLSFDPFFPGFIDAFTVNNSTGAFALAPLLPVASDVTFTGGTLVVEGSSPGNTPLGDLGPGGFQSLVSDFDTFTSASFQAQLSTTLFTLSDGRHFQADTNTVTTVLNPSSGGDLIPGVDFAPITISGSIVTAQVPEPPTWWLLVGMASLTMLFRRKRLRRA